MKGIVFVKLNEFVEETWGFEFWEELLDSATLPSKGVYTSVSIYDDQELFALVTAIAQSKSMHPDAVQKVFGRWLFKELYAAAPAEVHQFTDVFTFLHGVQNVIHVEVKKLNPDVLLPEFVFMEESECSLTFEYISPRHMAQFCEGLIYGCADHVGQSVQVTHVECVHRGDKRSVIRVDKV